MAQRISTFSIVVGTQACNARCQFCVSQMTGMDELSLGRRGVINKVNLRKAVHFAQMGGTTTVLFTGKGEPTLYPDEITEYLELLEGKFPFFEIQTNGLEIGRLARDGVSKIPHLTVDTLRRWYQLGLNTIALSVVGVKAEHNRPVYHQDYPDLAVTVKFLHSLGFSVRLCVMMKIGSVDSVDELKNVISFCKENKIEQLTVRPIRKPNETHSDPTYEYVSTYGLIPEMEEELKTWIRTNGTLLQTLSFGAQIFDISGQNICLSDCLTVAGQTDEIRTLIFYSSGLLTYDWQHDGAILLGGNLPNEGKLVQIK